jgi:hypothetical protein
MGLEDDSDTFNFFIRPSFFKDQQAGDAYVKNPPAAILRLTPKEPVNLDPYGVPELRVRGTGKTEHDLTPALNDLRKAILAKYGSRRGMRLSREVSMCTGLPAMHCICGLVGSSNSTRPRRHC